LAPNVRSRRVLVLAAVSLGCLVAAPSARTTGTLDQQQTAVAGEIGVSQSFWLAETFTAGITGTLDHVDLAARQNIGFGLPLIVEIRTVTSGLPSATTLSTTTTTVVNPTFTAFVAIPLSTPTAVTSGVQYAIAVGVDGAGLFGPRSTDARRRNTGSVHRRNGGTERRWRQRVGVADQHRDRSCLRDLRDPCGTDVDGPVQERRLEDLRDLQEPG
jgi:hypothetical protein